VKSLVPFPDVLTLMNDQLDWTQQLGDAVLAQQQDVLNAVQVLHGRAQAAGALQSGPQQTVNVAPVVNVTAAPDAAVAPPPQVISIAPTQPDQVFVPAYNPSVVYGTWPYPAYPPTYYPPPVGWGVGNALLTGMAFAGGVAVVNSLWGWASPGWGRGDVDINVNRYNNINANRTQISNNRWRHDVSHRHGVAYRNQEVRNTFRGGGAGIAGDRAQAREQFRGRVQQAERGGGTGARRPDGVGDRAGLADRRLEGGRDRPDLAERRGQGGARAERPAVQHRPNGRPQTRRTAAHHAPQGLQGVGHGRQERAAAERGRASRQGQPAAHRGGGRAVHHGGGRRHR
jgi:hypothetical protein